MNQFTADYLANLTADLSVQVLNALGRRLRTALQGAEGEQALRRSVRAGLAAMLALASHVPAEEMDLLQDIFTQFFEEQEVAREIAGLLRGKPLDRYEMHYLFKEAGFDPETLPGIDFDAGLDAFRGAFLLAATEDLALQNTLSTANLLEQTRLQTETLHALA